MRWMIRGMQRFTLSFDLLFRGLEITTGGQRIHSYQQLLDKIEAKKMTTEGLEQYLDTFRHGMPPSRRTWYRAGATGPCS